MNQKIAVAVQGDNTVVRENYGIRFLLIENKMTFPDFSNIYNSE